VEVVGVLGRWGKLGGLIMGNYKANRMEGGKGLTCALIRRIGKMLCWDFTFIQKAKGW